MIHKILKIDILHEPIFFTLYADGAASDLITEPNKTVLYYLPESIIFLYYTYPTHRRVYCIRFTNGQIVNTLPNLSSPVVILFKQLASRVDKTKKAVSYLKEHYSNYVFSLPDLFYLRLSILLDKKGKLDYKALDMLIQRSL